MGAMLASLRPRPYAEALLGFYQVITRHRSLVWEMTLRDLRGRHAGQVLGTVWILGHPWFVIALYVFLFAYVFPGRVSGAEVSGRTLVTYILAGLVPWLSFADAMGRGAVAVTSESSLVKQVVFPIDVLPIRSALVAFIGQVVSLPLLFAVVVVADGGVPLTVVWLPVLLILQVAAMIGVCYILSALTVYLRDVQELVRVFVTVGLFIAPILYQPTWIDRVFPAFALLIYLNPFSHMVWCYQDLLFFGEFAHPWSWLLFSLFSTLSLLVGFRLFRRLKPLFGDVL